jgi:hypothetical protein
VYFGEGILFADGTNVPPEESRSEDYYCPFDESEAETFEDGIMLAYIIAFVYLGVTIGITALIWKKYWDHKIDPLTRPRMIGMNDFVVMTIVLIDFFQYAAMGPSFASLS